MQNVKSLDKSLNENYLDPDSEEEELLDDELDSDSGNLHDTCE